MNVSITVSTTNGSISHSLSPSCGFSYDDTMQIAGVECRIASGMCTEFAGRGVVTLTCTGASSEKSAMASFPCPAVEVTPESP